MRCDNKGSESQAQYRLLKIPELKNFLLLR